MADSSAIFSGLERHIKSRADHPTLFPLSCEAHNVPASVVSNLLVSPCFSLEPSDDFGAWPALEPGLMKAWSWLSFSAFIVDTLENICQDIIHTVETAWKDGRQREVFLFKSWLHCAALAGLDLIDPPTSAFFLSAGIRGVSNRLNKKFFKRILYMFELFSFIPF